MNTSNPELQRLLASLNGSHNGVLARSGPVGGQMPVNSIPGLGALPYEVTSMSSPQMKSGSGPGAVSNPPQHTLQASRLNTDRMGLITPAPDGSSITTWPAAIKHVTKHLSTDEKVMFRIKHLMNEQHKHEEQWWSQRQAIVTKHAGRSGNQTKVADILKELGGLAAPMAEVDEAADKNELAAFDKKVYKSLVQMAADFDGQLRKMGVPFYVIKHDLVIRDGGKSEGGANMRKLTGNELKGLQKRMLQHLEDLLSDD